MQLKAAGLTHVGMQRSQNQDRFWIDVERQVFLVADGMGGHKGGEIASELAVSAVKKYFETTISPSGQLQSPEKALREAFFQANQCIQERAKQEPNLQGMGTTCTLAYLNANKIWISHVGDSRCYLVRPEQIWQLTRDHSVVQEKLRAGVITRTQLKTDRSKNVLTRSVGFEPFLEIDIYQMDILSGDTFLLCSDGLYGLVEDGNIRDVICNENSLEKTVDTLIATANKNGGNDNVTAIAIKCI